MSLTFTVYGVAQPQGSSRAFVPKGWTRPIVTSANPKNKGWRQLVAEAANVALQQQAFVPVHGAVALCVRFYLPRPKRLNRQPAVPHLTKPDLDKLVRSVADALKSVAWQDDAQVTAIDATKQYAEPDGVPRAVVTVSPND